MTEWRNIKIPLAWSTTGQFYLSVFQAGDKDLECVPVRRYNDGETVLMGEPIKFKDSNKFVELLNDAHRGWFDAWTDKEDYLDG